MDTCCGLHPRIAQRHGQNHKDKISTAGRDLTKDPLTWNEIDERLAHMEASRASRDADPHWQRMVAAVGARKSGKAPLYSRVPPTADQVTRSAAPSLIALATAGLMLLCAGVLLSKNVFLWSP